MMEGSSGALGVLEYKRLHNELDVDVESSLN